LGEGAELERRIGVVAHGEAIDGKPEITKLASNFRWPFADMVGEIEIKISQPCNLGGARRHLH